MSTKLLCLFAVFFILACNSQTSKASEKSKSISLFKGMHIHKWKGDERVWSFENNCIVGRTTDEIKIDQNTFLIYEDAFSDFELTFQYKIIGGNSGVQYRSTVINQKDFVVKGYQADMEAGIQYSGILYEEKGRGILANRGQRVVISEIGEKSTEQFIKSSEIQEVINQDEWNSYKIIANGNHLQHFINGVKTVDVLDKDLENKSGSGVFALQVHKGPSMTVHYKDMVLRIRE